MNVGLLGLIIAFILVIVVFVLVAVTSDWKDIKYYKITYDLIKNKNYQLTYVLGGYMTFSDGTRGDITFFDDYAVKLVNNSYIHNFIFTFFNPFACYYFFKFKKLKKEIYERIKYQDEIERSFNIIRKRKKTYGDFKLLRGR